MLGGRFWLVWTFWAVMEVVVAVMAVVGRGWMGWVCCDGGMLKVAGDAKEQLEQGPEVEI